MSFAFLDIQSANAPSSRIVIELFDKDAPETCRFFKSLLTGTIGYKGTRFTRIIDEFMIQGGDVALAKNGGTLPQEMENAEAKVNNAGLVGLARTNVAEINAQFFITLASSEHLNGKHTIFGRVVKGIEMVQKIGAVEVDENDVPLPGNEVVIVNCGELQPRTQRETDPPKPSISPKRTRARTHRERSRSQSPHKEHRDRGTRGHSPSRKGKADQRGRSHPSDDKSERDASRKDDGHRRQHHRQRTSHHRAERHSGSHGEPPARQERENGSRKRERSRSPNGKSPSRPSIPTAPRDYRPRRQYQPESNYGRLRYDVGYDDDMRDGAYEDRIRQVERERERDRKEEEPKVVFKGRGAMKFRER